MKLVALTVAALALTCCGRGANDKNAVRQGVLDYLSTRQNLSLTAMNVDVTSVTFRGKEADATVSFAPKGSGAGAGMTINYVLERQGNRWVVKGRGNGGGMPHAGAMPQGMGGSPHGGMPPMPGLDTGKGAQGAAPGQLPPGHPAVKGSDKK